MNYRKILKLLAIPLLFLLTSSITTAQTRALPVNVVNNSSDNLGGEFIYEVKEQLRSSSSLRLVYESGDNIQLIISTMDMDIDDYNSATIYSIVWNLGSSGNAAIFYNSTLGYCGRDRLKSCARSIVAGTSDIADEIRSYNSN